MATLLCKRKPAKTAKTVSTAVRYALANTEVRYRPADHPQLIPVEGFDKLMEIVAQAAETGEPVGAVRRKAVKS